MTGVSNESSLSQHLHLIEIPYGLIDGLSVVGIWCMCIRRTPHADRFG
ncbi:hypothetical protein 20Sep418_00047 [Pseudomonas phage 20Sep418]|uniref:Uncharacterized protein n=2 Tax=Pakpunavirus TaxID=1921407 RepID=A0AAE9GLX8_9CAUD|nr:hypothetical protein QE347_gp180 [Pseudomonas phage vB_Paer_Ps12]UOL47636.1 hypothetical protein vBPaerPs12_180c [Pseudomonas phage vB_Paer_Ps12]UOL47823.1 hypothetical protein vBPaerPs25_179c [Pseudomonas phage vB_Paer_Ps25]WFG37208.1 hypothetical protein 9081_00107 [Pseudomonas phage bmx-p3]WFG37722.1 hypothetical protein 20Sep418_00047 [Pseudomonas phage 20Sep418]